MASKSELSGSFTLMVDVPAFAKNKQAALALRKGLSDFFNCTVGDLSVTVTDQSGNANETSGPSLRNLLLMLHMDTQDRAVVTIRFQVRIPNASDSLAFAEASKDKDRLEQSITKAMVEAGFGNTISLDPNSGIFVDVVPGGHGSAPAPTAASDKT